MKLTTAEIRRAMFGRADRTEVYVVQVWTVDAEGKPYIWRSRAAWTVAGVNRIKKGRELTHGVRGEVWISVLRVQEVDTTPV